MILILAVVGACMPAASAAETSGPADAREPARRRVERERQFLYRALEELNKSQGYVKETIRSLERDQRRDIVDPSRREKDSAGLLVWYRTYADWLAGSMADFEADLSAAYADDRGGVVRADRCYAMADGYAKLGAQLDELVVHLDKVNDRTLQRMALLRDALAYVSSSAFIEERNRDRDKDREKDKEKKQNEPGREHGKRKKEKDDLYERYKNITDIDIAMMQLELKNLDELQKHFVALIAQGRMEQAWIGRKTLDYEALGQLARYAGRDAPDAIEEASNRMIKLYESDIAYFKGKVEDLSRARAAVVPVGSLKTIDRLEELLDNYDDMKSRYEHHIAWLSEQAGAYRADIIEARRERQ
jgi:hypothetical protein